MFPQFAWLDKHRKLIVMTLIKDKGFEGIYKADLKAGVHYARAIIVNGEIKFFDSGGQNSISSEGEACTVEDYFANLKERSKG